MSPPADWSPYGRLNSHASSPAITTPLSTAWFPPQTSRHFIVCGSAGAGAAGMADARPGRFLGETLRAQRGQSLQPLEPPPALRDVLVVPLNLNGLLQPALEVLGRNLIFGGVPGLRGLECSLGREA